MLWEAILKENNAPGSNLKGKRCSGKQFYSKNDVLEASLKRKQRNRSNFKGKATI